MVRRTKMMLATGLLSLVLAACEMVPPHAPSMSVNATRKDLLVNESATVLIASENTLGTHPKVEWSTTLGKVTPIKEGMLDFRSDKPTAIFTSDKPGEAVVTARLTMDDGQVLSDSVKIKVNSVQ